MLSRVKSIGAVAALIVLFAVSTAGAQAVGGTAGHSSIGPLYASRSIILDRNWSGYAAAANPSGTGTAVINRVQGNWVVPNLACVVRPNMGVASPQYADIWVGLGGLRHTAEEQVGTTVGCVNGLPVFKAWYFLNNRITMATMLVRPGDVFYGAVENTQNTRSNQVRLTLVNETLALSFARTVLLPPTILPHGQTAEWIVSTPAADEAGDATLADFGTLKFMQCQVSINGHLGPINDVRWMHWGLEISDNLSTTHVDDALGPLSANGQHFTVTYKQG
jgi:hypothetical protein